ncbi:MAG: PAS domain S-box protein [Spirochaetia bacterium]|nr:PAS domain S-box protein [Spirochaetia bacterium]
MDREELLKENERLRLRVRQAEAALQAAGMGKELGAVVPGTAQNAHIDSPSEMTHIAQAFIDEMVDGALVTDKSGVIAYCNESFCKLLGYGKDEIIGSKLTSYFAANSKVLVTTGLIEVSGGSKKKCQEVQIVGKEEKEVPASVSIIPLVFEGLLHLCITLYDLSEERRREKQLVSEKEKFETLFNHIADAVFIHSLEGQILEVNEAACTRLEYPREEFLKKNISEIDSPQFKSLFSARVADLQKTGDALFETVHIGRSGRAIPVEVHAQVIRFEGRKVVLSVVRNTGDRKKAEKALRKSESRYRDLFDSIRDAILVANTDRIITDCNAAFTSIFGYTLEEIRGKPTEYVYENKEQFAEMGEAIKKNNDEKKNFLYSVNYRKKNGQVFPGEARVYYIKNEYGEITGFIGLIRDVTEKKELETQLFLSQKLDAVGRLAGGIAHDFNNMLMVIKGFAQIIRKKTDPEAVEYGHLMEIEKAVKRAADLTHQLLAFSRKQELVFENVDINSVLEDSKKMLDRLIAADINLDIISDPKVPLIHADMNQLHQIIMNLATNARDAMPSGGNLVYRVEEAEFFKTTKEHSRIIYPGKYVVLRVTDNGEGMTADTVAHLFEPFYTTKKSGKGTGLGLATVYGTVKQLKGYIFCDSEVGKGSEFSLYFPAVEGEISAVEMEEAPEKLTGEEVILLVEDEDMVRSSLGLTLREWGYSVLEAEDAETGWELFQRRSSEIDLLITDIVMPGESGLELAARIQAVSPEMKIVFMTGYSEGNMDKWEGLLEGWKRFEKPIEPDELVYELRKFLDS